MHGLKLPQLLPLVLAHVRAYFGYHVILYLVPEPLLLRNVHFFARERFQIDGLVLHLTFDPSIMRPLLLGQRLVALFTARLVIDIERVEKHSQVLLREVLICAMAL